MLRKCPVLLCMKKLVSGSAFRSSTPQQPCKIAFTLVPEMFRWPYCSGKDMKDGPYTRDRRDFDNSTQKKAQGHPTAKNCMTKEGSLALSSALVPISFIVRLFSISLIPLLNEWSSLCCSASVPYPLSTQITANFPGSHGASRSVLRSVWLLEWWHGTATKPPSKPSTQFPVSRTFPLRLAHKMFRGYRKDESVLRSLQFASLFFFQLYPLFSWCRSLSWWPFQVTCQIRPQAHRRQGAAKNGEWCVLFRVNFRAIPRWSLESVYSASCPSTIKACLIRTRRRGVLPFASNLH